nr:hypothetical protein [Anaerohalosphaera lusitana]
MVYGVFIFVVFWGAEGGVELSAAVELVAPGEGEVVAEDFAGVSGFHSILIHPAALCFGKANVMTLPKTGFSEMIAVSFFDHLLAVSRACMVV